MDNPTLMYFAMWHMRCEILRHAQKESCILSSRLLCELYRQLGIKAMPLPVDVIVANRAAYEKERHGEEWDISGPNEPAFAARCAVVPGGGDPDSDSWLAHLAVLADGRYLCDPSADQFARPDKGIIVKPSMFEFESDDALEQWLYGEHERRGVELPGGGMISYEAHPEEISYRESPDWIESNEGDGLYDSVMTKTHGLIGIYEDVEELPPLPDLPSGKNRNRPPTAKSLAEDLASMAELGYSVEDLVRRQQDEAERSVRRKARRTSQSGSGTD